MSQLSIKVCMIICYPSVVSEFNQSISSFQLNQQKGATSQDLSFLKEASPIYVTSLSGNSVTTTSSSTTSHSVTNELTVADSSEYVKAQQRVCIPALTPVCPTCMWRILPLFQTIGRPCPGSAQPVSETVNQYNNVNKSVSVSKYNANAGVNQNNSVAQNINNNSSSARTLLNNNHLVNSNISASEVTSATTKNSSQAVANNRILDYNHFYETNNNTAISTGESQYNLANGHSSNAGADEVSV